jgi:uncharacterized protein (TIGR02246 family)
MKRTRSRGTLATIALAAVACSLLWPIAGTRAADESTAGIKTLADGYTDSFNQHDPHALSMWFTEDGDFISVQQTTSHGRKAIEDHFEELFSARLKNAHRTCTVKNVRFITPDVATVTMDYILTDTIGLNGEKVPVRKGLYDWIVSRQNGKWLISVLHESELPPAPGMVPVH